MAQLKVFWTKTAVEQRNFVFSYWNNRNKSKAYSKKLNENIKTRIALLKSNPDIGISTDFLNTRALSLGHYSIFYQVQDRKIFITGFWDNRQDPKKLIEFLRNL